MRGHTAQGQRAKAEGKQAAKQGESKKHRERRRIRIMESTRSMESIRNAEGAGATPVARVAEGVPTAQAPRSPKSTLTAHYEWIITGCCFLFLFVNIGFPSTSFSVYQPYLAALPEVGNVGASTIITVRSVVSLLALMLTDKLIARFDVRIVAAAACALTGAGFMCYSFAQSLFGFVAGAVIAGTGYGTGGMVCMTVLLNRWFNEDVGTAVGIAAVGSGVAGVIVPALATVLIAHGSLRLSFFLEGAAALAVAALVIALVRNRPSDVGAQPHGASEERTSEPSRSHKHNRARAHCCSEVPVPAKVRARLNLAMFLVGGVSCGGMSYLAILMTSEGFGTAFAGGLVSATGLFLVASKILTGRAFDRLGGSRATGVFFVLLASGLALCCLMPLRIVPLTVAGALLYGVGVSLATVGLPVWSIELSDETHQLKDVKGFQVSYAAGGAAFNFLPGVIMEFVGTYAVSYAAMAGCAILAAALILQAYLWKQCATRPIILD